MKITDAVIEISIEDLLGEHLEYLHEVRNAFAGVTSADGGFGIGPIKNVVTRAGSFDSVLRFFHSALYLRFSAISLEAQQVIVQSISTLMSNQRKMHMRIRIGWTRDKPRYMKVEAFATSQGYYGEGLAFRLSGG